MTTFTTFYLSRILGKKVFDQNGQSLGIVKDLLIEYNYSVQAPERPLVNGIKLKKGNSEKFYSFGSFKIEKNDGKINISCCKSELIPISNVENSLLLAEVFLDKQIVDLNGRKLVRVNDVRIVSLIEGTYAIAVDIGIEGLLRRIGIAKPLKTIFSKLGVSIPAKFILWEDVEAINFSNLNIKLSKTYSKLHTLHPSDLADIIEDLGKKSRALVFSSLDEERAADVLEELEQDAQIQIIESLPVEKMADVLEKMPADEVADILDALEYDKAETLLKEMEEESSNEVRELLEYEDYSVGSIMSTEILTFKENHTVQEVIDQLRMLKPEAEELYTLFVVDENEVLIATFTLRDIVLSMPETRLSQIMTPSPLYLHDFEKIDDIAENISKYNLLAIPVVDFNDILLGMVVISDIVEDLINKRRTNK